jgi:hypothetical protein
MVSRAVSTGTSPPQVRSPTGDSGPEPERYASPVKGRTRRARVRRLLGCLALGALAPLGSIRTGSIGAAVVVGLGAATFAWIAGDMLGER